MISTMANENQNDSDYYVITKIVVNKQNMSDSYKEDDRLKKIRFNSDITIYEYKYKKNTILKKIKKYFCIKNALL